MASGVRDAARGTTCQLFFLALLAITPAVRDLNLGIEERVVQIVGTLSAGIVNNDLWRSRYANRILSGHRGLELTNRVGEICHDAPGEA